MKTFSIDRQANRVYIDGEGRKVNCAGIPDDIHAVQWDEARGVGWIEYEQDPMAKPWEGKPHKKITSRESYQALLDAWASVMSDDDVGKDTELRCAVETLEARISDRKRDGLPTDQLETEKKQMLAEQEAVHAKYRKAKVKG